MTATLTTKISLLLTALLNNTVGIASADGNIDRTTQFSWASGFGADQADKVYSTTITRTHGAPAGDLDLAGVLTDVFGAVITMARLKALIVLPLAANVNSVVVGGGAPGSALSTLFFDYVATALAQPAMRVRPGGMLCLVAPQATAYVVTGGTGDKLQVASGDEDAVTSVTTDVIVIGASA